MTMQLFHWVNYNFMNDKERCCPNVLLWQIITPIFYLQPTHVDHQIPYTTQRTDNGPLFIFFDNIFLSQHDWRNSTIIFVKTALEGYEEILKNTSKSSPQTSHPSTSPIAQVSTQDPFEKSKFLQISTLEKPQQIPWIQYTHVLLMTPLIRSHHLNSQCWILCRSWTQSSLLWWMSWLRRWEGGKEEWMWMNMDAMRTTDNQSEANPSLPCWTSTFLAYHVDKKPSKGQSVGKCICDPTDSS